jgi:DNA-binding transcriptional LysR family regulator
LPLLPAFCRQYPQLRLQYSFNSSFDDLLAEKLDIAIRLGNLKNSSLKSRKLGEYAIYLVATPQFANQCSIKNIEDLAHIPWVTHSLLNLQDSQYILQNCHGEKFGLPLLNSQYESNSAETIRQLALASLGAAICPAWLIEEDLKAQRLVRLLPEFELPKQNIQLLYPNTQTLPAKTRAFIEFLVGKLKE